jgi:predicted dehydrogenase
MRAGRSHRRTAAPSLNAVQTLVISSRLTELRRHALTAALGRDQQLTFLTDAALLPALDDYDAIVLDGHPVPRPAGELSTIATHVAAGGSLVALGAAPHARDGFWAPLLGVVADDPHPAGEYFAKVVAGHSHLTLRLAPEFPVVDRFEPLRLLDRGGQVAMEVSVGFCDEAAVVETPRGEGRAVAVGLGNTAESLATPWLVKLLRRALLPRRARQCCGRSIGLAVVGYGPYGGMGYYHGLAARATPGLEFVATCDTGVERRKAAETDFPGIRAYASTDELLADEDVEVVVVATPPAFHAGLALQLLRAGKHVACEKPLCLTVTEADELIAAARTAARVLTVNQNRRWDPDFVAIRRLVSAGMLGELFNVETFVGGFEHPCRAWHSEVSVSGGAVYDWGSHHVDWILELLAGQDGPGPTTVVCHGHKRVWHDVSNLDQLRVRMVWADGREAEFFQSDVAAVRRPKFYLQGTTGTLVGHYRPVTFERIEPGRGYVAETAHHAEAPATLTLARYDSGYGISETRLPVAPEQRFAFHHNLADHLHLGEPLAVTAESVRRVIAVLEGAHQSSLEGGRPVTLSP